MKITALGNKVIVRIATGENISGDRRTSRRRPPRACRARPRVCRLAARRHCLRVPDRRARLVVRHRRRAAGPHRQGCGHRRVGPTGLGVTVTGRATRAHLIGEDHSFCD